MIDSVRLVGRETGFAQEGEAEACRLEAGFDKIRQVVAKIEEESLPAARSEAPVTAGTAEAGAGGVASPAHKKPKVAFLEWLEPLFNGGHWIPDLVRTAGGGYTMAEPGEWEPTWYSSTAVPRTYVVYFSRCIICSATGGPYSSKLHPIPSIGRRELELLVW